MDGIGAFFDMGGYGIYVWPAFAVTAVVLIGLLAVSLRSLRENEETLDDLQVERRRGATAAENSADGAEGDGR